MKKQRPQTPKPRRSRDQQQAVLDLRRSSAASPHRPASDYRRKPKHTGRGWTDDH